MIYRIIVLFLILSGCAAPSPPKDYVFYQGEELPLESVASIAIGPNVKGVQVLSIDGVPVPFIVDGIIATWKGAHVLPGKHVLLLNGNSKNLGVATTSTRGQMVVEVKAGHTYIPYFELDEKKEVVFKILDAGKNYNQSCLIGTYPDHTGERKNAKNCL